MKDETKRQVINENDGVTSARPLPCHTEPYRKVYNKFGELMNPITKNNPYFVKQKRRIPKTRKRPTMNEYIQIIPLYEDAKGNPIPLKKATSFDKFVGVKTIIHTRNKSL